MTESESDIHNSEDLQSQSKGEFLDAIRRHICQILGFDFGFIDIATGHEIDNVASFCFDDEADVAKEFVESLVDEHKQPITVANTLVAQKVKQTQRSWVGKAYSLEDVEKGLDEDSEGFPYMIVPVLSNPGARAGEVMGLIRVISFDAAREITTQDLTTLKLMGEHLASRTGLFGDLADQVAMAKQTGDAGDLDNVLIVHSNRLVRRRFNRILGNGYHVIEGESSERALELLDENRVDVILLDSELQGASGFGFCKVLKETTKWKHIPVILVVTDNSASARVEGLNVGADDCIPDSCLDAELIARIRSSLRHRKSERELSVQLQLLEDYAQRLEKAHEQLSIDRQTTVQRNSQLEVLKREGEVQRHQDNLLHRISNVIRKSFNIRENLEEMLEALSGWFSLDSTFIVMPNEDEPEDTVRVECVSDKAYKVVAYDRDLDIFEIFKKNFQADQAIIANDAASDRRLDPFHKILKSGFSVQSLFFIPITYEQKLQGLLVGYKCEARAAWSRINETFMKAVVDQVAVGVVNARLYATVQRQATTDGLTGLYNHRTGQEKLADQLKQAERYQRRLSVIMLDVDHFKSINDTYGHPAGDSVLKSVARLIRNSCRDVDIPVRYGGEEFLLVLPEITQDGATVVAERIRTTLKSEVICHEDLEIKITASLGVASFPDDADSQQYLLDLADKSLYLSKRLGRDQVHTAADLMFEPEVVEDKSSEAVAKTVRDGAFTPPVISEEARQHEELVPEVVDMVKSLAASLYAKSDYNKQHHLEVARMSELLAKVMGLSAQQVEQIRVAGLLHDVGVLQLPQELLEKEGNLTKEEREVVNQHATLGAQMLRPVRALKDICEILENHHERWDGTGYPKGLKGEDIPLPARIVAIVDSYHALISIRPYRPAMTHDEALKILKDGAGKQWDPFLIEIFSAVMKSMRETTQEVQAKVAMAATLAKAAAEQNVASQTTLDEKNKNGEAGGSAAAHSHNQAEHSHEHAHSHDHSHSHDRPDQLHERSHEHPQPQSQDSKKSTDQMFALAEPGTARSSATKFEEEETPESGVERSKISSIIGPLIKPISPKPDTPNDDRTPLQSSPMPDPNAQQQQGSPSSAGLRLPEKTGFAVPAPGQQTNQEQTGAPTGLVRPLPAVGNPSPPDAVRGQSSASGQPGQQSQYSQGNQPAWQSPQQQIQPQPFQPQPANLNQTAQQPQGQPQNQQPPTTFQPQTPLGYQPQPGQPLIGQPLSTNAPSERPQQTVPAGSSQQPSPDATAQAPTPSIYGRPSPGPPGEPSQRSPIIPPPNHPDSQSHQGISQGSGAQPHMQTQAETPQKPLGMNPQAPAGPTLIGRPGTSYGNLPAQGTGAPRPGPSGFPAGAAPSQGLPGGTGGQEFPTSDATAGPQPAQAPQSVPAGYPRPYAAGQPVFSDQNQQTNQPQTMPGSQPPQFPGNSPAGMPPGMPTSPRRTGQNLQPVAPINALQAQSSQPPAVPGIGSQVPPGFQQHPQGSQTPGAGAQQFGAGPQPPPIPGAPQNLQGLQPQPTAAQQPPVPSPAPPVISHQPPGAQSPPGADVQPYVPTVTGVQHYAQGPKPPQVSQPPHVPQTQEGSNVPQAAPGPQPYSVPQQSTPLNQPAQPSPSTMQPNLVPPQIQGAPSTATSGGATNAPTATAGNQQQPQQNASTSAAQNQSQKQPDTWDPYSYDEEDEIEGEL